MNTIAAIATPEAVGGVSMIRISGEAALEIAAKIFRLTGGKNVAEMGGYTAAYGFIEDNGEKIDDGVLLIFRNPHSYTGEDVAEITCHGGIYVTRRVLTACIKAGAVPAQAGEFTKRALLNGKLSLTQAEAVIDVINAQNQQYLECSNAQKDGALFKRLESISETILNITTQIAAWIDYPDEMMDDIYEISSQVGQLTQCQLQLHLLIESYDIGKIVREGVQTAIVGKPNVGKSTIMNLLSGSEKSIVTNIAGTTRDIVEERVMLGGAVLNLSDCAGIHETDDIIEQIGVRRAIKALEQASLVFAVFDNSRPLESEDYELIERLRGKNVICIISKTDLENKLDMPYLATQFGIVAEVSMKDPQSLDRINSVVAKTLQLDRLDLATGFIANERQRQCAVMAEEALSEAINGMNSGITPDATGVMLERALNCIYELSGKSVSDTVIDEVFKRFCVGK